MKAASTLIVSASLLVVVVRLQRLELLGVAKPWKKKGQGKPCRLLRSAHECVVLLCLLQV